MPTLLELKAANKANIRDKTAPGSATRANVADALDAGLDFTAAAVTPATYFLARADVRQTLAGSTFQRVAFGALERQAGAGAAGWQAANSQYVAPTTGLYSISGGIEAAFNGASISSVLYLMLFVNNARTRDLFIVPTPAPGAYYGASATKDVWLNAGDTIELQTWNDAGGGQLLGDEAFRTSFSARLVARE